ncbi:MAG TPA: hypothetical protein VK463_18755, partial [Desulfomonilaceae bacterium]|nr:hypothetical protein [Desulfomonilaceae bacterium]
MKLIKTLRRAIASTFSKAKRRPASQPPRQERGGGPKNGRLTVAVAVSILVMIGLGAINIRLIRDPSIAGKAFKPIFSNRTEPDGKTQPLSTKEAAHAKACTTPTEVTFYRNLTSQDDVGSETGNARGTGQEVEQDPKDAKSGDSKSGEKKEESKP